MMTGLSFDWCHPSTLLLRGWEAREDRRGLMMTVLSPYVALVVSMCVCSVNNESNYNSSSAVHQSTNSWGPSPIKKKKKDPSRCWECVFYTTLCCSLLLLLCHRPYGIKRGADVTLFVAIMSLHLTLKRCTWKSKSILYMNKEEMLRNLQNATLIVTIMRLEYAS